VGDVAVGTVFETLLTKRRGVVRAHGPEGTLVELNGQPRGSFVKTLHPDVRVRVVSVVTH
jgi:hypothetical protein